MHGAKPHPHRQLGALQDRIVSAISDAWHQELSPNFGDGLKDQAAWA